jgi:alkylresorcinol/alkylpyrone synthase
MPTITTIATAVPPHTLTPDEAKQLLTDLFALDSRRQQAVERMVDNSAIQRRYGAYSPQQIAQPRDLTLDTIAYREHAILLSTCVVEDCLKQAGLRPDQIDIIISVSCTGIIMPSLDAYLINHFGFRRDVIRLPITELACMGGAAGLARARELSLAYPDKNILLVDVELPSVTYQHNDPSPANLISSIIFGDGAACVLIQGRAEHGINMIDSESHFFPDTLDAMGFDLHSEGLHIVLSKDVPDLLRDGFCQPAETLLGRHGLKIPSIAAWLLHPGGRKILEYLEAVLHLPREKTQPSWDILRDYGNMSSVTVLFVLNEWLNKRRMPADSYGLLTAFGPGLSTELLLLQWQ